MLKRLRDKRDYVTMSINPYITWEVVQAHPDKPWEWSLSANPSLTFDIGAAHPDKPWHWSNLSVNPSITFDNIRQRHGAPG